MRLSQLFVATAREIPSDSQLVGQGLLVRGGFVHQVAAGIYTYLPLGRRVMNKIEGILHEEMARIGGQEMTMPVVLPADLWKETGRWYRIGSELTRLQDRKEHDLVLAMTHEEAVGDVTRSVIASYRQLPRLVYHIQTKWRDDPRPRAGLIRVREFTMKDSYSLDSSWEGLELQYRSHYQAYFNIFRRCGIEVIAVKSDTGMMGGKLAHEFMYILPSGEDSIVLCDRCGYSSNRQVAVQKKEAVAPEEQLPMRRVETPGHKTIEALSEFLSIPESKTGKMVFMMATMHENSDGESRDVQTLVAALLRGDMDLNETKLSNVVGATELRPATDEEIVAAGAVPGYASPIGLQGAIVVVDSLIPESCNMVVGANVEGYHSLNFNYGRDYSSEIVEDITAVKEGAPCSVCEAPLRVVRAVEMGNIFQLGTSYSESLGCTFQDSDGSVKPVVMGSYGIGVGRLLGCVAEEYNDERGLVWPVTIAPYQVHLIQLHNNSMESLSSMAEELYTTLLGAGIEVLYDDRKERPGVMFADADLIGVPIRLTISKRALDAGGVECKLRSVDEKSILPLDEVVAWVQDAIAEMQRKIEATLKTEEYQHSV